MELEIVRVENASVPSKEYVVLQASEDTNLNLWAVVDSTFNPDGSMSNEHRHVYFFPAKAIKKGEYVVLYSGTGINGRTEKFTDKNANYYVYFWQSSSCIWNNTGDNASLIRYGNSNSVRVPAV